MANYGLTALMESINRSETAQKQNDKLMVLFESVADDDIASKVTGEDYELSEDSVVNDMAGQGIGYKDEKKLEKLIATIPEDDSDDIDINEENIESVIESVLANI